MFAGFRAWQRARQHRKLQRALLNAAMFLEDYGDRAWPPRLRRIAEIDQPERAAHETRALFGGMGALNDRVISATNGDRVAPGEEDAANQRAMRVIGAVSHHARTLEKATSAQRR